jgi:hypothetical protein
LFSDLFIALQDKAEDLQSVDSCEYIWEAGVGFATHPTHTPQHDYNRTEILKLLLTCFSETIYVPPVGKLWDRVMKITCVAIIHDELDFYHCIADTVMYSIIIQSPLKVEVISTQNVFNPILGSIFICYVFQLDA